jgi:hypothetical protein
MFFLFAFAFLTTFLAGILLVVFLVLVFVVADFFAINLLPPALSAFSFRNTL